MKAKEAAAEKKKPKTSAAQIRVQKGTYIPLTCRLGFQRTLLITPFILDLAELEIPSTIELTFPDPADILKFEVKISPDDGMYH
jgi:ubiquitin-conjugating enzyme E2 M